MRFLASGYRLLTDAASAWNLTPESARRLYAGRLKAVGRIGMVNVYRAEDVDRITRERAAKGLCLLPGEQVDRT